jgi:hypothetical protein
MSEEPLYRHGNRTPLQEGLRSGLFFGVIFGLGMAVGFIIGGPQRRLAVVAMTVVCSALYGLGVGLEARRRERRRRP